jgi:hypothetical protein
VKKRKESGFERERKKGSNREVNGTKKGGVEGERD